MTSLSRPFLNRLALICLSLGATASVAEAQQYAVQRVLGGLDRPTYLTQAPGDNTTLYIIENQIGTGTTGTGVGRIIAYNPVNQAQSTVLEFDQIDTTLEGGVHTMAFHPDFETNGKFYVNWLEDGDGKNPSNFDYGNVTEFIMDENGQGQFSKTVLRFELFDAASTHGLDWVGFDPTATTEDERNYMYITIGDSGFDGANANRSQNLTYTNGKIHRVDVRGDEFGVDPDRNFSVPPTNPYVNDPQNPNAVPSIVKSGLRNPWRASFDRATGDLYLGDVGLSTREEISFYKASEGDTGIDFGWSRWEGTLERTAIPALQPDPRFPIHELDHNTGNFSMTGGYVYRGPISELQGMYIYGDYVSGNIWTANFDRDTDPTTFNGNNLTNIQQVDSLWESLVLGGASLDLVVSFAEDNEGNVYVIDFGTGGVFNPNYDAGEIFKLVPTQDLFVEIDRSTGQTQVVNQTGGALSIRGVTMSSVVGAMDTVNWTPIAGTRDMGPPGNGTVDLNDQWQIDNADAYLLSESEPDGDGAPLADTANVPLGSAWLQNPTEDVIATITLADGTNVIAAASFVGDPLKLGDLTFDGSVTLADWAEFKTGYSADLTGLSPAQIFQLGDLNGDLVVNLADAGLFARAYDAENGAGSFAADIGAVPEPGTLLLASLTLATLCGCYRRLRRQGR